jgi:hypothetical protein
MLRRAPQTTLYCRAVTANFKRHRMSKSIHITIKNFRGLTKTELDEQSTDSNSDLKHWSNKSAIKKEIKKKRKIDKSKNQ